MAVVFPQEIARIYFFLTEFKCVLFLIYQWVKTLVILGNVLSKTSGGKAAL